MNDPFLLSLALEIAGLPAEVQPIVLERLNEIQRKNKDDVYAPGWARGQAYDGFSRADEAIVDNLDELQNSVLGEDSSNDGWGSLGEKDVLAKTPEEQKGYNQMSFMASMISNLRTVLNELETPGLCEMLDKAFSGSCSMEDLIAEAHAKDSSLEPILIRFANTADEAVYDSATALLAKVNSEMSSNPEELRILTNQVYRRAIILRIIEAISFYYSLKDVPQNRHLSFPLDMPYSHIDYADGMELFQDEEMEEGNSESSIPRKDREKEFRKLLKDKLGVAVQLSNTDTEEKVASVDNLSTEDWQKVIRNYYTPPKTRLQHIREEWLSSLKTKEGTSWERMQDLRDEHNLKFVHRRR